MLFQRLISAAVGIPLIVAAIWVGDELLAAIAAIAVFTASIEISAARGVARTPGGVLTAALAAALPIAALSGTDDLLGAAVVIILLLSILLTFTLDPKSSVEGWLWSVTLALYFGLLGAHFVLLRETNGSAIQAELNLDNPGRNLLIFAVLTVWLADTGAYFLGRVIGRHKLAPAISPGKTVEGAIGSIAAGFAAVFGLDLALSLDLALEHRIGLGLILPVLTIFGDLAESAIKRAIGVKDSSGIVPGHGGIADRLDSLLFAVPAVYWYVQWIIL